MIDLNEHFKVNNSKFISSAFGDEMMLMNLETGHYIALNKVSADIYNQAHENTTAVKIIDFLLASYNVEREECMGQVLSCIEDMLEKELLIKL